MECISILEREIADLRKTLAEKETELCEIKKKWLSKPQDNQMQANPNGFHGQAHVERLPRWAIERYSRQILLPEIGVEGQAALLAAKVLLVGAGGLGCPAAAYLAGAGVGEIGLVDYDTVDVTNIHRQLLHGEIDQGTSKVQSAAAALRRINSNVTVTTHDTQLSSTNALDIVGRYHMVLDCSDNVPTRYLLNDACSLTKLPLISGSALKMEGQLTIYGYRAPKDPNEKEAYQGPCYRCLFPSPPPPETVGSCSANGVAGPVPGLIGVLQALEAIKLIVGYPHNKLLVERMLIFDGDDCTFRNVKLRPRNAECAACSASPTITRLIDYEAYCKAKASDKKKADAKIKSQRRKEEKEKRMSGQSYYGFRRDRDRAKWVQDVLKQERKMGPACSSPFCKKGMARKCPSFSEDVRMKIFDYFWNELDWAGKKNFVRSLVDNIPAKRRRLKHKGEISRKGDSKLYHLVYNDQKLPVCRTTFLNTLGVKEAMIRCWLVKEDRPKEPKKPLKALNVETYIDSLPKVEIKCPYCKSTPMYSDLFYLDLSSVKNQYQLYNHYVKDMKLKGLVPASRKTFSKVFLAKNLKIFKPKNESDVCDIVSQHNVMNSSYQLDNLNLDLGQSVININYTTQW
ncbi:adenylyltransferase and sulfurtransferase MOCS3 [Cydia fagiglandana]|uniref:adenylyltransferase and sulfurtransferase MOCS3 n=1 Tax=Cydia fagiglandana TaxID=1458189 RepID=UPI002FEDE8D6